MAKRKRLSPIPQGVASAAPGPEVSAPEGAPRPALAPIAQVAGDAAASAAARELAETMARARAEGRLVLSLPCAAVETGWLMRDRLEVAAGDDFEALVESLRAHGQRTPVEVAEIGEGRFGLISGWRRMAALARLEAETGDARFGQVLALLRRPEGAAAAYVAMVEENEIRLGLSYYERARIAARAVEQGLFDSDLAALRQLFAGASRAKRSKIGSFLSVVRALDGALAFPAALPERLGLRLAKWLEADPARGKRLAAALAAEPAPDAAGELARLAAAMAGPGRGASAASEDEAAAPGIRLQRTGKPGALRLTLSGPGVDGDFAARLRAWLAAEAGNGARNGARIGARIGAGGAAADRGEENDGGGPA